MRKKWKSLTSVQWFKALETWKPSQVRCLRSQEGDEMNFLAWIDLYPCFQFSIFQPKTQVLFSMYGAAWSQWARGFPSVLMCECFRLRNLIKIHALMWKIFDLQTIIFQSFFMLFSSQSYPINFNSSLIWFARNIEDIICTKRFEIVGLTFFMYFN